MALQHLQTQPIQTNWHRGNAGETCDTVCGKLERSCNSEQQSLLTTENKVRSKFLEAGYTCRGFHDARDFGGAPFSTGRDDDCGPIIAGKKSVCDQNVYSNHHALCFCE